ncbi:MAG: sugar ABC transporter substrate-binding protein [Chthoniobacteraceae bacterium]
MQRAKVVLIAIVFLAIGIFAGAVLRTRTDSTPDPARERRYAINVAYSTQPFWTEVTGTGQKIGTVVPGVKFVNGGPSDADASKQIAELDTLISQKVSGIILFPADPKSLAPTINRAAENGIPVVTLFSDVPGSKRLTLIGAPEYESGRRIAQKVFDAHPEFAKIKTKVLASFNKPGETVTDARLAGIKSVLEDPKYREAVDLVQVVDDYGNDAKAAEAIAPLLAKHKDIKVIFGLNARSAIGAYTAIKEARQESGEPYKPGDIVITGWDSDEDVLNHIEDGWIFATSVLNSSLSTQIAFGVLEAQNLGYLYPDSLKLRELSFPALPNEILVPETLVDKTNVAGYRRKAR